MVSGEEYLKYVTEIALSGGFLRIESEIEGVGADTGCLLRKTVQNLNITLCCILNMLCFCVQL